MCTDAGGERWHAPSQGRQIVSKPLACVAALLFGTQALAADKSSVLLDVFKARAGAVQSFQAKVRVTSSGGRDLVALSAAMRQLASWTEQHNKTLAHKVPQVLETAANIERQPAVETDYYHYWAQLPGSFRVQRYDSETEFKEGLRENADVWIYTGDRWKIYVPAFAGQDQNVLTIRSQHNTFIPPFEVARGQGIVADIIVERRTKASARAMGMSQMLWGEFLERMTKPDSAVDLLEPLPGGNKPQPLVQIDAGPAGPAGNGGYRIRCWFDLNNGQCPLRLECQHRELCASKEFYLNDFVVEWSEPEKLPNGFVFPKRCLLRGFTRYAKPVQGVLDSNDWPGESYETRVQEFRFADVRVNEPLAADLFDVKPPSGTAVIDYVAGTRYVVGSAGEELRKRALQMAEDIIPPEPLTPAGSWRFILLIVNVIVIALVGLAIVLHRRRQKRSATG
jgi:hypothetical protein